MDNTPLPTKPNYRNDLYIGIITLLLGPICCVAGGMINRQLAIMSSSFMDLTAFFADGNLYILIVLVALGLVIFGFVKQPKSAETSSGKTYSIIGLVLTFLGLCFWLAVWGAFLILPCGLFGC